VANFFAQKPSEDDEIIRIKFAILKHNSL